MEAPPPAAQPQHYRISQHHNHRPYGGGEGGGPVELTKEPSHSDSNNNDNNEDRCGAELRAQLDCNLTSLCDHIQLEGFNNGAFSDVIVQSMGSVYHLHRLILSRSSYFRNMLQGPWKEANAPVLTLHVDDNNVNGEAMEIALTYLYGHHPKLNENNAFRVLAVASFLDLQISKDPSIFQEDLVNLEEYLLADDQDLSVLAGNFSLASPEDTKKRQRKSSSDNQEVIADNKGKKILPKELERQRRQEMAKLYASLRSLLPLEYIKGKRAVSDHMNEAAKYIKEMQKNIQELSLRRDKIKKIYTSGSNSNLMPNCVSVSPCRDGLEILIASSSKEGGFPLSRVLVELIRRRLNVVSCVTTRANDRFLHRIHFEDTASDLTFIDIQALQERLNNMINLC